MNWGGKQTKRPWQLAGLCGGGWKVNNCVSFGFKIVGHNVSEITTSPAPWVRSYSIQFNPSHLQLLFIFVNINFGFCCAIINKCWNSNRIGGVEKMSSVGSCNSHTGYFCWALIMIKSLDQLPPVIFMKDKSGRNLPNLLKNEPGPKIACIGWILGCCSPALSVQQPKKCLWTVDINSTKGYF